MAAAHIDQELRISPRPALIMLLVASTLAPLVLRTSTGMTERLSVSIVLYTLAAVAWVAGWWRQTLGHWMTIVAFTIALWMAHTLLGIPGTLALLALPVILAAAFLGPWAMDVTGAAETALLLLAWSSAATVSGPEVAVAIAAVWATAGVMHMVYRPIFHLARWSWEEFEQARDLLERTRDRQAELGETLDALAHANRELALANDKLAVMRHIAEEAQRSKAAFVANVSHELRTPLNIIIGLADILLDSPRVFGEELSPNVEHNLGILHRNCEHLASMINDVLDLSQVEAGRMALSKEPTNLMNLVNSALVVVRPLLATKGLDLTISAPPDLPLVPCDPTRIRQVILNLMSNAARFTERGGIAVTVQLEGRYVMVSVSDTGPGISPEDARRIFEPFQQGSQSLRRQFGGSGLGLAISRQFVELHEGRMWLESASGAGSTFHFRLPVVEFAGPSAPPERWVTEGWSERTARAGASTSAPARAVIVSGEHAELGALFSRYASDVEFVSAADLDQAAEVMAHAPVQSLVVNAGSSDVVVSRVLEASARFGDMPVVGCVLPSRTNRARAAGAATYLIKPISRSALEGALEAVGRPLRRVLLADDDADTIWYLTCALRAYDGAIAIDTVTTGAEALARMREVRPDVVLLDLVMPGLTGWQFLEVKGQEEAIRDIPVIIVSAQDPSDRPVSSRLVVATMGDGLSISKVLRCFQGLSSLLLRPD